MEDKKDEGIPGSGFSGASGLVGGGADSWGKCAGSSLTGPLPPTTWLYGRKLNSWVKSIRGDDEARESPVVTAASVDILDRASSSSSSSWFGSSKALSAGSIPGLEEDRWGSWVAEEEDGVLLCNSIRYVSSSPFRACSLWCGEGEYEVTLGPRGYFKEKGGKKGCGSTASPGHVLGWWDLGVNIPRSSAFMLPDGRSNTGPSRSVGSVFTLSSSLAWLFLTWRVRWSFLPKRWAQYWHRKSLRPVWTTMWRRTSLRV